MPKDETRAFISLDYNCPYCHYHNAELILIGASGVPTTDSNFETDQVCGICSKEVIVECRF